MTPMLASRGRRWTTRLEAAPQATARRGSAAKLRREARAAFWRDFQVQAASGSPVLRTWRRAALRRPLTCPGRQLPAKCLRRLIPTSVPPAPVSGSAPRRFSRIHSKSSQRSASRLDNSGPGSSDRPARSSSRVRQTPSFRSRSLRSRRARSAVSDQGVICVMVFLCQPHRRALGGFEPFVAW